MTLRADEPRVAIVVPVYGHPVLVGEALDSALAQEADFGIHVVVVNDGCPLPETHETLRAIALAHPDRLTYLRQPNGGLSAARNAGIAHVLSHLPSVEALFMLDADNRLRPRAMANAMAVLDADPEAGWVYPSIDMFGIMARCDYGGPYSRLIHSQMNVSEAGSLIRRTVFEAGVMFDETFKHGFEDWHFFLSAGDAGFRGRNCESFGFFYRKRPESMLANADRLRDLLVGEIQRAHPDLYRPFHQLQLEQEEAPRYAFWLQDRGKVLLATDPDHPGEELPIEAFIRHYWAHRTAPMQYRVPPYLVVTTRDTLSTLSDHGLLHTLLWHLECAAPEPENRAFAALTVARMPGRLHVTPVPFGWGAGNESAKTAPIWMIGAGALQKLLDGDEADLPEPAGRWLRMDAPPTLPDTSLEAALDALRTTPWRAAAGEGWRWRNMSIGLRGQEHRILRTTVTEGALSCPILPRVPRAHAAEIGLLMPEGDPPETFAPLLDALQAERQAGARLHLFGIGESIANIPVGPQIDSITWLGKPEFDGQDAGRLHFDAVPLPGAPADLAAQGLSLLVGLSALHILATADRLPATAQLAGTLRRWGARVTLHLPDAPMLAEGIALARAYEHAFDRIEVPGDAMLNDLHLRGIARTKLATRAPGATRADP